jgi:dienelactone hydrolase
VPALPLVLRSAPVPLALALLLWRAPAAAQPAQEVFVLRPLPPPGKPLAAEVRAALEARVRGAEALIDPLRARPGAAGALPDVEVLVRAVRVALRDEGFHHPDDAIAAGRLLALAEERARHLAEGRTPWLERPGPTVLGYVSRLDASVLPYGLFLPPTYAERSARRFRLDAWFHGRDETLSEIRFIAGALRGGGPFERPDALTLQPYGRYCNASKLAGEVDFLEALGDVKRRFLVDEDRIVVRGFSMGGAATWHVAAHHAADWAAAAPGAGFAESRRYLEGRFKESLTPTWWEERLWQLYDAPAYAENFRNVPVVAYSGELDVQKQAADVMAEALERVGVKLVHVIGPGTGHTYHPRARAEINRLVDALAARGRDPLPPRLSLATPTLRYNRQAWIVVDALGRHWDKAIVEGELRDGREVRLTTRNVAALTLDVPAGRSPFAEAPPVILDGQRLPGPPPRSDRSWRASFHREGLRWRPGPLPGAGLRKRHGLQGPIDDAFMGPFLMVSPSGKPRSAAVARWTEAEEARAVRQWQLVFRGDPRRKRDVEVTAEDIAAHNLVLWGDPASNAVLGRIAGGLPIRWEAEGIAAAGARHAPDRHALIAIYPNPLAPDRYVVLNSGFTFREYDHLTNARQTPKLPDWAIVDVTTPPDERRPGKIVDAGFFGERWELREDRGAPASPPRRPRRPR